MENPLPTLSIKRISFISVLSFTFCMCSIVLMIFNIINSVISLVEVQNTTIILGIVLLLFVIASLVLGVIDVCSKDRKKMLSIISLVISGILFGIFIIILMILTLYTSSGPTY